MLAGNTIIHKLSHSCTAFFVFHCEKKTKRIIITKGLLYIGIVVVGQHRSHTFANSAFPWQ